jgi:hypothetical protein
MKGNILLKYELKLLFNDLNDDFRMFRRIKQEIYQIMENKK